MLYMYFKYIAIMYENTGSDMVHQSESRELKLMW